MTKKIFLGLALMLILLVPTTVLSARAETAPPAPSDSDKFTFNAGGATFPYPLIDKWRVVYNADNPGIKLNYQAVGSGAGIKLFMSKKVDFAGSDAPLQAADIAKLAPAVKYQSGGGFYGTPTTVAPIVALHIPETMGAIVVVYNLPGVQKNGLYLTGDVIAKIFSGQIYYWHDDAIVKLQKDPTIAQALKNDANKIIVIHRSDGSGTTFAFTSYLSQISSTWKGQIGKGTSVPWPVGMGGSGNAGVAAIVKKVPESVGYVELSYAKNNMMASLTGNGASVTGSGLIPMTYAFVQNHDKTAFLDATTENTVAAATGAISTLPSADGVWSNVSINNAPGPKSYPITTFTYLLVNENLDQTPGMTQQKAHDLVHLLYWFVTDGQKYSEKLSYVPLPPAVQDLDKKGISMLKFNGQQLWKYP